MGGGPHSFTHRIRWPPRLWSRVTAARRCAQHCQWQRQPQCRSQNCSAHWISLILALVPCPSFSAWCFSAAHRGRHRVMPQRCA